MTTMPIHPFDPLRRISGNIAYRRTSGEMWGFEDFAITADADGARTLAVHCQLETADMHIARDIVQAVDRDFMPTRASVHLSVDRRAAGHASYRFAADEVVCAAFAPGHATPRTLRLPVRHPHRGFGTHALQGDAWLTARMDTARGPHEQLFVGNIMCSDHHLGATGPGLMTTDSGFAYLGPEEIEVPAGRMACDRFRLVGSSVDHPPYDMWVSRCDWRLFVKGTVSGYMDSVFTLERLA